MAKYRVVYDRDVCIGVLACVAVNEKYWKVADGEAKVDLKGARQRKDGKWELIIEADDYPEMKESEEVCPVDAISIEKIED